MQSFYPIDQISYEGNKYNSNSLGDCIIIIIIVNNNNNNNNNIIIIISSSSSIIINVS